MNNFVTAREKERSKVEIMGQKRQEKALREFKQVLGDLVFLLRRASEMETVYMYWVNRSREQFVLETKSTALDNVMFQDRLDFKDHFLNDYKELSQAVTIEAGKDIPLSALNHYYNETPVQYVTLLPFVNNEETVAITVLESRNHIFTESKRDVIYSYINALRNVLNTYLEISDLHEQQNEWIDYESCLSGLEVRCHRAQMIKRLLNALQPFLYEGGASFITKGMKSWCNVMNSDEARFAPPIGMKMEKRSLAYEALDSGQPEFAIHFNNNPKRMSPREFDTDGASIAVPLMLNDRRQGVVLIYDKNPLIFKESTKHKLINLVRVAGLKMLSNDPRLDLDNPIFANEYGAIMPDVWEQSVDIELNRIKDGQQKYHSWFGLVTVSNLPELRTKLRLEQLNHMQRDLVAAFNPALFGFPGMLGFHSDYVYAFLVQGRDDTIIEQWAEALQKKFSTDFELSNGIHIDTGIKIGYVALDEKYDDSYEITNKAKSALSQALNSNKNQVI